MKQLTCLVVKKIVIAVWVDHIVAMVDQLAVMFRIHLVSCHVRVDHIAVMELRTTNQID